MGRPSGFTLIELLVVITIIVVLLALLTPALDKAIYQAELTVCAASFDGLASGTQSYAVEHKRRYPNLSAAGRATPRILHQGQDYRPIVAQYVDVNGAFNDPMLEQVDYESQTQGVWMWTGVHWFSAFGANGGGNKKLFRMGDRMTFTEPSNGEVHRFNILAGDRDFQWDGQNNSSLSHPDADGVLRSVAVNESRDDSSGNPVDTLAAAGTDAGVIAPITFAHWTGPLRRGSVDMNWAFTDGSVRRYDKILVDLDEGAEDERVVSHPQEQSLGRYNDEGLRIKIPPQ